MKKILSLFSILFSLTGFSQSDSVYKSISVVNKVYSSEYNSSLKKIYGFLNINNINIDSQKEDKKYVELEFKLNEIQYKEYELLIPNLGYSKLKKLTTIDNTLKINDLNLELVYLKAKNNSYTNLLAKLNEKDDNYLGLWNEQNILEGKIFTKNSELIKLAANQNIYIVSLDLIEESMSPEYTEVSFVNMPGIEYSILNIEAPLPGLSASTYQGYSLKYLFTRGKSYINFGALKNNQIAASDTTTFSEIFIYSFGQDFYSRHLGRGTRKFLNLYSSYAIGGFSASGEVSKDNFLFIAPGIGLELFKNKYILIDSKVSYLIPFKNNRNFRGTNFSTSLNFVF